MKELKKIPGVRVLRDYSVILFSCFSSGLSGGWKQEKGGRQEPPRVRRFHPVAGAGAGLASSAWTVGAEDGSRRRLSASALALSENPEGLDGGCPAHFPKLA